MAVASLFAGGTAVASPAASPPVGGFTVRPAHVDPSDPATASYFKRETPDGGSWSDQVVVGNTSDRPVDLFVSAVDGLTGQTSGAVYADRQDPVHKAGGWVTVGAPEVTVAADSQLPVGFTVRVPPGAPAGDHLAGVAFENADPVTSGSGFRVTEVFRAVVGVLVTVPGPAAFVPRVGKAWLARLAGPGIAAVMVTVSDAGLLLGKPVLTVALSGPGGYRRTSTRSLDTVLAGDSIDYPFAWADDLAPGRYEITATITGGGATMTVHTVSDLGSALSGTNSLKPRRATPSAPTGIPWGAIPAVAVAGVAAGFLVHRRRPRRHPAPPAGGDTAITPGLRPT
jgi:hypothetical protein